MVEPGRTGAKRSSSSQAVVVSIKKNISYTGRPADIISGKIQMYELTMDELRLGRIMNEKGIIPATQKPLPPAVIAQMSREFRRRLLAEFDRYGQDAIDTIADVMYSGEGAQTGRDQKEGTKKLDAAKYIIERIVGKIPDKTEITQNITVWQGLAEGGELFVDVDIEEAEIVQETEPEPRPRPQTRVKRGPRTRPQRRSE